MHHESTTRMAQIRATGAVQPSAPYMNQSKHQATVNPSACPHLPPSQVQRHKCRDKKCYGKCEEGEPKVCKYGYPREFCNKDLAKSTITGRNIYRCEKKEDQRLSPYIPLWLLATGLSTLTPLVLAYEL